MPEETVIVHKLETHNSPIPEGTVVVGDMRVGLAQSESQYWGKEPICPLAFDGCPGALNRTTFFSTCTDYQYYIPIIVRSIIN